MQIQQINIEGFGTLSNCHISGLSNGLTVVYGRNGTGKTTLMHFLRGVFCGFDDARRMRLLPPLKLGTPGGSVTLQTSQGRFEVIRHARADHSDTLAISLLEGVAKDVEEVRKSFSSLSEKVVSSLFAVSGYAAHDLNGLLQFALDEAVELASRKTHVNSISDEVRRMEAEHTSLYRTAPTPDDLLALEQKKEQIHRELKTTRKVQRDQLQSWQHSLRSLRQKIQRLTKLGLWQDQELHATESDLTEVQTRLWSTRETTVQDVQTIQRTAEPVKSEWLEEIAAIDREIAHAQQVLRDLAASRMNLSVSKAEFAGAEILDLDLVLQRQRNSLTVIESRTDQLNDVLTRLQQASRCLCGNVSVRLQANVESIREQVWLLCQELGRQQSSHQQALVQTQREGVDRCEVELSRQIQRLRMRRDELTRNGNRTIADQIRTRTRHDANGCQCDGHEDAVTEFSQSVANPSLPPQIVVRERKVVTSNARSGDADAELKLKARRQKIRHERSLTTEQLRIARVELQQLKQAAKEFAGDCPAQSIHNAYARVEQQLADAREQWHSLTLLQSILQQAQRTVEVETISPVLADASRLLERMTEGRYLHIRWNNSTADLRVVNAADVELPCRALSRGTLEQTVLSFRLALCREFQRRGIEVPLILDDVLADSDEDRLRAAIDVLVEFARDHQVVFLTCQEHLLEIFEAHDAPVLCLPGSAPPVRRTSGSVTEPVVEQPAKEETCEASEETSEADDNSIDDEELVTDLWDRVQPDEPFWLQAASPISQVPSLGSQMSRRMGALGVRTVAELVELDPEVAEMPLDSLQISALTLRHWQAEARLLCCVPSLTGRDAQLLVACGIHTPAELAECDEEDLFSRIRQMRSQHSPDYRLTSRESGWPSRSQVTSWIRSGRSARSWRRAREWSAGRRIHLRHRKSGPRFRPFVSPTQSETNPRVRLHKQAEATETKWKFYLNVQDPIVDAPSIGPRTAERLNFIGIHTVSQLLAGDAREIASRLNRKRVTAEVVTAWQQQASLMCRVPQLRGHDVQVLVRCGIIEPEELASSSPEQLFAVVKPFVESSEGIRLLRSASVPDLAEVTDWISFARHSPLLRAA